MRKNLFIIIALVLGVLILTTPKSISAADNMCNVNPGSCTSDADWISGWFAAREPENVSAAPQQTEWSNASQPEPEVIRVANEDNSVNRSQIAADDAAARGGDPVNPSTVTETTPPPGGCPSGTIPDGVTCKLGTAEATTAVPTTASVGGGTRSGVWGEYGVDCDRSTGVCTGAVNVYSCSSSQIQTGSGGGPICLQGLWQTSGSVNCVDIANQTCSFVQLDVVTADPFSGSAITCYPTRDCTTALPPTTPTPSLGQNLPPPQTMPGDNPAAGGGEPAVGGGTQSPTGTVPPGGPAGACVATRLYINSSPTPATPAQIAALRIGDTIRLAVKGNLASFTKGRFVIKLNNSVLATQETATKQNLPGDPATFEFIYDHTITQGGNYSIEGSIWQ